MEGDFSIEREKMTRLQQSRGGKTRGVRHVSMIECPKAKRKKGHASLRKHPLKGETASLQATALKPRMQTKKELSSLNLAISNEQDRLFVVTREKEKTTIAASQYLLGQGRRTERTIVLPVGGGVALTEKKAL